MKILKYAPFVLSSILIFTLFQVLININFPNKNYFEKTYIIDSRIDDTYNYFDTTKGFNLKLYSDSIEKFLINSHEYCYVTKTKKKICAVADSMGNGYLSISFRKFIEFDLVDKNKHLEVLEEIKNDNLNYLISQIKFLQVLEKSTYSRGDSEFITYDINNEEFLSNFEDLQLMELIHIKNINKETPTFLLSLLAFLISCIFGYAISISLKSFLKKNS